MLHGHMFRRVDMSVLGLEKRRVKFSHMSANFGRLALAKFHLERNWVSVSSTLLTVVWII